MKKIKKELGTIDDETEAWLRAIEAKKEEIQSAWQSESNSAKKIKESKVEEVPKIDKNIARKYYPIRIKETDEHRIISIPGGCFWFHYTLISKRNIGIFDVQTEINSYKRYSFMRMYKIYQELKEKPVENLLLMEYSLGIGFANQVYNYLCGVCTDKDIQNLVEIGIELTEICPFFIRKKVTDIVCGVIDFEDNLENYSNEILPLLSCINNIVNTIFSDTLELWWYVYFLYGDRTNNINGFDVTSFYIIELKLREHFGQYFNCDKAYMDSINYCNVYDWRNVSEVDDCFVNIPEFRYSDVQYSGTTNLFGPINNINVGYIEIGNNRKKLYVEVPVNEIGKDVLERVIKNFSRIKIPDNEVLLYQLYYKYREKEFNNLKKKQEKEFYDKDVRIGKKLKPIHIYTMLQYRIVETLLLSS